MERIRDKLLLCVCCFSFILYKNTTDMSYIALLMGICISCLYEYDQKDCALKIYSGIYLLCAFFFPVFGILYPFMAYDLFRKEVWYLLLTGFLLFLRALSLLNYDAFFGTLLMLCLIISFILSYSTKRYNLLIKDYKKQRDSGKELELLLKIKQRDLIEKQDYEVHVATLRERNRIAREIHDNVGHMLSRSILQVGALSAIASEDIVQNQLEILSETLNTAMNNIRQSVHDLHDESFDLEDNIHKVMNSYSQYQVYFDYDISETTRKEIKYCFLTIIKEAFSNVVKHSNADKITITIREFTGFYQFLFHDNGTNYKEKVMTGIGLENMHDRIYALNGNINIQTTSGFKIFISIPKQKGESA